MGRFERSVYIFVGIAIGCLLIALTLIAISPGPASGHDHARPDLDSWYPTLTSRKGPCCDGPKVDATHLDDPDWQTTGNLDSPYRVRLPGSSDWIDVPETAVVHQPNVDGRALVWPMWIDGQRAVRCFLPGTLS